jgi:hypothetical protein
MIMDKITLPNEQAVRTYIKEIYLRAVALDKTKIEFHTFLQDKIAELASTFYLTPTKEYVLPNFRGDRDGHVDVVWCIGSIPVVAIEIDSICRTKSVKKLISVNSNLHFWVYYGVSPFESFVKSIDLTGKINVIHFPTKFGKYGIKLETVKALEISKNESSSPTKSYTFSDVRLKYQKAYEQWSVEQDEFLKDSFQKGLTVSEIANQLQRKPGAIRSRIKKLRLH